MKKFETLVGSDAAGTLKDLPLDEAGLSQEGAAASNGAVVRSDLPLFKTGDIEFSAFTCNPFVSNDNSLFAFKC